MWKLVSKDAPFAMREWMKKITTACAENYKTVIIFKTPSRENIISEVLEPHRAGIKVITHMQPKVKPAVVKPVIEETVKAVKEEIPEKKIDLPIDTPKKTPPVNENTEKKIEQTVKKVEEEIKTAVKNNRKKLEKSPNKVIKNIFLILGSGGGFWGVYEYLKNRTGKK